jgi:putative hydrolase of the HAD superfamily
MPDPHALDAVLFDLGSTLIYFDSPWTEVLPEADAALVAALCAAGLTLDEDSFLEGFRQRLAYYYAERDTEFIEYTTAYILRGLLAEHGYPNPADGLVAAALGAMYRVSQAHWQPEADAIPTLQALRQRGYRLGVVSNAGDDADVQSLIDKAGVRPYLDVILSSARVGIRKPNPRIFHLALEQLGVAPQKAAMVGDTLGADILGARNAGLLGIWITRRADSAANRAHADTIQPDAAVATLAELPDLLESLAPRN